MKTFVAYRHTGEDPKQLGQLMQSIKAGLTESGIEFYCTYFSEQNFVAEKLSASDIMYHAFEIIDKQDFLLVILNSHEKSEGMLMEVGYCIAKGIPILVAIKEGVTGTYVPQMAAKEIQYKDTGDLEKKLASLKLTF